jgi:hypothetical protein
MVRFIGLTLLDISVLKLTSTRTNRPAETVITPIYCTDSLKG